MKSKYSFKQKVGSRFLLSSAICILTMAALRATEIRNGDFEEDFTQQSEHNPFSDAGWTIVPPDAVIPGWSPNTKSSGNIEAISDAKIAHGGNSCVLINSGALIASPLLDVSKNDKLEVSCWAKASSGNAKVGLRIYVYERQSASEVKFLKEFQFDEEISSSWTKVSHVFEIPDLSPTDVNAAFIALESPNGCYFDDVTVEQK